MVIFGRKNNKQGTYGFSKYDNEGRVIYSESKGSFGELIKHHYKYNDLGMRIYYAEYTNDELTLEESKTYIGNLTYINTILYKENVYNKKIVNSIGREIYIKSINLNDNSSITKIYDSDTYTYNVQYGFEIFIPQSV